MSRWLKIALAVSVALNLFAAAAAVTVVATQARVERDVADRGRRDRSGGGFWPAVNALEPDVRARVKQTLRTHALEARPDFEAARAARRQAMELAGQPVFDSSEVQALLEQSRLAELRGRAALERGAIELLSTLEQRDRRALAGVLLRQGPRLRDHRPDDRPSSAGPPRTP